MDVFYVFIEINRNFKLKNKFFVVGENIVIIVSYEVRKYDIYLVMKVFDVKLFCFKFIVFFVDKIEYIRIFNEIYNLILKIINKVEFVVIDEGYIDLIDVIKLENKKVFVIKFK